MPPHAAPASLGRRGIVLGVTEVVVSHSKSLLQSKTMLWRPKEVGGSQQGAGGGGVSLKIASAVENNAVAAQRSMTFSAAALILMIERFSRSLKYAS